MIKSTKHKKKRLIQSESWMTEGAKLVLRAAQQMLVADYAGYMLVSGRPVVVWLQATGWQL